MNILNQTTILRETIQRLESKVSKDTRIKASKVAVMSPSFDVDAGLITGMTHTPISGSEVYTTRVNLKTKSVRCTCEAGGFGRLCKHTIALGRWLDDRLDIDQRAIEHALNNSLVGTHQIISQQRKSA
jgi:hypothetical protein